MAEITATLGHNSGTIRTSVGDTLAVQLPENPTTGYRWQQNEAEFSAEVAPCIGDRFEPTEISASGAGGNRIFRFAMRSRGAITLKFSLARPWEQQLNSPRDSYSLSAEIS